MQIGIELSKPKVKIPKILVKRDWGIESLRI